MYSIVEMLNYELATIKGHVKYAQVPSWIFKDLLKEFPEELTTLNQDGSLDVVLNQGKKLKVSVNHPEGMRKLVSENGVNFYA